MKISSGEFIARIDQDDECIPSRFQKQVSLLEGDNTIDCVGSYMIINNGFSKLKVKKIIRKPNLMELLKGGYAFFHPTIMIRRNVLDELGGYRNEKSCNLCEDLDLWYRFFINGYKGLNIQEGLIFYSETSEDLSKRKLGRALIVFNLRNHYRKVCKKSVFYNFYYLKSILFASLPSTLKYLLINRVSN